MGNVPSTATAIIADVTAIQPSATTFLTLYKDGGTRPGTSNLNATSGAVVNKEVTIPLNTQNGKFDIYNVSGTVNVTVDVEGYYSGGTGSDFVASTPQRICDTRSNSNTTPCVGKKIGSGGTLTLQAAGVAGVPSTATAVVVSVTTLNETAAGFLTIYPTGASQPTTSQINFTSGAYVNNEVTVEVGTNGNISLSNSTGDSTDVLVDLLGYYTPAPTPHSSTTATDCGPG